MHKKLGSVDSLVFHPLKVPEAEEILKKWHQEEWIAEIQAKRKEQQALTQGENNGIALVLYMTVEEYGPESESGYEPLLTVKENIFG